MPTFAATRAYRRSAFVAAFSASLEGELLALLGRRALDLLACLASGPLPLGAGPLRLGGGVLDLVGHGLRRVRRPCPRPLRLKDPLEPAAFLVGLAKVAQQALRILGTRAGPVGDLLQPLVDPPLVDPAFSQQPPGFLRRGTLAGGGFGEAVLERALRRPPVDGSRCARRRGLARARAD
jgi:hypothetical protein